MWSGPRNVSTAMMRSWENREDTIVVDEPFYAAYLLRTGIDHPGRQTVIASQPTDPPEVVAALQRGDLMGAIKQIRALKPNMGLAEARALLEALQKQAQAGTAAATAARVKVHASMTPMKATHHEAAPAPRPSDLSPGEMPRTTGAALFAAILLAVLFVLGVAFYL
jgi:hypothetical protein